MTVRFRNSTGLSRHHPNRIPVVGFTLIELMIAMVLGLLIIGAVITVFLSTQQSYRLKTDFDNRQEAVRFASHAIMRVVQTSQSVISEDSSGNELSVDIRGRDGALDCVGTPVPDEVVFRNSFYVQDSILFCRLDSADIDSTEFALVSGVNEIVFRYADTDDMTAPVDDGDYRSHDDVDVWGNVRSVRTTLRMNPLAGGDVFELTFTSTSRGAAIGDSIIVSPN